MKFEIKREVVLPATPEEVFAAVTTGNASYLFPTPNTEPDSPTTTVWDPPNRVTVREEGAHGWFNALEYVIEAADGGTAVLRYVHSGMLTDDWDTQYDGASKHTDFYLHSLAEYLGHFAGRPVTYVSADGPESSGEPGSFGVLLRALGAAGSAIGDPVTIDVPGLVLTTAVVDYRNDWFLGLRSPDTLYRFYGRNHFGGTVDAAHHIFRTDIDAAAHEAAWSNWLTAVYA